jgi:hypothetical protein
LQKYQLWLEEKADETFNNYRNDEKSEDFIEDED